ncbi:Glycosyltransferase Family 4 [Loktanella sp. DSM 29012]|uniref:glycosyltransferase family 4 protein n=1 Tax=Loktanella sp. DSM 29012 TaxID=1881056 RepID=UPI0008BBEE5D|nr:glycosyltransferase family 4 protein [Loktanella sp. DSM 29012]SEQ03216.1 Glycosyltransferase Family 4 [Loktanella sp. DSM 29012]
MTDQPVVLHLVDDSTAGGVMRVVDFLVNDGRLQAGARHVTQQIERGKVPSAVLDADVIVSHLTLNWRGLPGLIGLRAANAGTPLIHVEHSYTEGFVNRNVVSRARFMTLMRVAFSLFDRVVAVSHAQAEWFASRQLCDAGRLVTIQSCVDLCDFRAVPDRVGPVRVFGAIGRLEPQKGFDHLISAFRGCPDPDIALHIYGEGGEEDALRALAAGDARIRFMGFAATPAAAYAAVDAVVMPSRWEAYGLVAIEALAAGRPVIAAAIDGLRDHAALGAMLYDETSPKALDRSLTQRHIAAARHLTAGLEDRFVACWDNLLADLLLQSRTDEVAMAQAA